MDIYETLKHNKIKKIDFARRVGLKTTEGLKYAVNNRPTTLEDSLIVYVMERSGVSIYELIKDKIR